MIMFEYILHSQIWILNYRFPRRLTHIRSRMHNLIIILSAICFGQSLSSHLLLRFAIAHDENDDHDDEDEQQNRGDDYDDEQWHGHVADASCAFVVVLITVVVAIIDAVAHERLIDTFKVAVPAAVLHVGAAIRLTNHVRRQRDVIGVRWGRLCAWVVRQHDFVARGRRLHNRINFRVEIITIRLKNRFGIFGNLPLQLDFVHHLHLGTNRLIDFEFQFRTEIDGFSQI